MRTHKLIYRDGRYAVAALGGSQLTFSYRTSGLINYRLTRLTMHFYCIETANWTWMRRDVRMIWSVSSEFRFLPSENFVQLLRLSSNAPRDLSLVLTGVWSWSTRVSEVKLPLSWVVIIERLCLPRASDQEYYSWRWLEV